MPSESVYLPECECRENKWIDEKFPRKAAIAQIETVFKEEPSYVKSGVELTTADRSILINVTVVNSTGLTGEESDGFMLSWQELDQYAPDAKLFNRERNR